MWYRGDRQGRCRLPDDGDVDGGVDDGGGDVVVVAAGADGAWPGIGRADSGGIWQVAQNDGATLLC